MTQKPAIEEIEIYTDFVKLDAFLKFAAAVETGGAAKGVIQEGLVEVNGQVCTMRGRKLRDGDKVSFNGGVLLVRQAVKAEKIK